MLDELLIFSDDQDIFDTDDDVDSSVIDLGVADPNQGPGKKKKVVVEVGTAVSGGTSIKAGLYESADASTYTLVAEGPVVLVAAALAGKKLLEVMLPDTHGRYLKIVYTNAGANTAGTAYAYIDIP